MTSSMPSGDGTVTDGPTQSALDDEAAPGTGLDPDTAADAAGESASAAGESQLEPQNRPDSGSVEASDEPAEATSETASSGSVAPADRTVLSGPALENPEMHIATDDLRSSEDKSAAAREIADELAATTDPTAGGA